MEISFESGAEVIELEELAGEYGVDFGVLKGMIKGRVNLLIRPEATMR